MDARRSKSWRSSSARLSLALPEHLGLERPPIGRKLTTTIDVAPEERGGFSSTR